MSSDDRTRPTEGFFGRWSRVKSEARHAQQVDVPDAPTPAADCAPELPPIESLTIDSDFKAFFHPEVAEDMRRAALRKLFSDPHFNVMDGLDVYIDDYSKSEPIPAAMLGTLRQAQRILEWAKEPEEKGQESADAQPGATRPPLPDSPSAPLAEVEAPVNGPPLSARGPAEKT